MSSEYDRLLQSSPPLRWRFDVINIVMAGINEILFLEPRQKRSLLLCKNKGKAAALCSTLDIELLLHDYFMTFALIPQHTLDYF